MLPQKNTPPEATGILAANASIRSFPRSETRSTVVLAIKRTYPGILMGQFDLGDILAAGVLRTILALIR